MFSMGDKYGHDATFVEDIPEDIKCSICHLVLKEPMQLMQCGHRFCSPCFDRMKRYSAQYNVELCCPNDREKIDLTQVFKDTAVARVIANLRVKCSFESNGCDWIGDLRNLQMHKDQCSHQLKENYDGTKSGDLDSTNALLKQMSQRLHKCEENLLSKEKDLACMKFNLREMKEKVSEQKKEIDSLKLKNIHIEQEMLLTKETIQQLKCYMEGEITILKNNKKFVENKEEIDSLKTAYLKVNEAQKNQDREIKSLNREIKELSNQLNIGNQSIKPIENTQPLEGDLKELKDQLSRATIESRSLRSHLDKSMNKLREKCNKLDTRLISCEQSLKEEIDKASFDDIDELMARIENTENQIFDYKLHPDVETVFVWRIQHYNYYSSVGEDIHSPKFYSEPDGHLCRLIGIWNAAKDETLKINLQICSGRSDNEKLEPFKMNFIFGTCCKNGNIFKTPLISVDKLGNNTHDMSFIMPNISSYIIDDSLTVICWLLH